jgi:hypothetical protein
MEEPPSDTRRFRDLVQRVARLEQPFGVIGTERPIHGKVWSVSKADLKEPGAEGRVMLPLPVTDSTPHVCGPMAPDRRADGPDFAGLCT